jgi:type II secretion system protein G
MIQVARFHRGTRTLKGFTLIELLIVIAIILILIAIALPNFLEAQTRAKVTKVQGEMRSMGTAIEAYFTDYNHYPKDGDDFEIIDPSLFNVQDRLKVITTPVAYITDLPSDPFHQELLGYQGEEFLFSNPPPFTYSYNTPDGFYDQGLGSNAGKPDAYGLSSPGPSLIFDSVAAQGALPYSATNGTKSAGDILRLVGSGHPMAVTQ